MIREDVLAATYGLHALDLELSRTLVRLAGEEDPRVRLAIALVSRKLREGHVCLPLEALCAGALPVDAEHAASALTSSPSPALPTFQEWVEALRKSPLCGDRQSRAPLVLDDDGRLYLHRYFAHEASVIRTLRERVSRPDEEVSAALLEQSLVRTFGPATSPPDLQRLAAERAVRRAFFVLSGGPGTGKTFTVAKVLALCIEQALELTGKAPRIHLLAPTGKAAARMLESLRNAKRGLAFSAEVLAAIPDRSSTIHRALASVRPDRGKLRVTTPLLDTDLVLVDEASMVDLSLMARLFSATPPHARIFLLGDKHQLASVEAGAVLGDICGAGLPEHALEHAHELRASIVHLVHSRRYRDDSGIGALARAINAGDVTETLHVLTSGKHGDVELRPPAKDERLPPALRDDVLRAYTPVFKTDDPAQALAAFDRFRVLCAHRKGLAGVVHTQQAITRLCYEHDAIDTPELHFAGAPLLVTQNDHRAELWNGDIGIVARARSGESKVACFVSAAGAVRKVGLSRLPPHESALAMSIHKSQGSEVDEVAVLLPKEGSPLLSRELLYTAVTRARSRVVIYATEACLRAALARSVDRSSGLAAGLYAPR